MKFGEGTLSAMGRLGLKELRNAINPSRESIADSELGMYGTATQGEIAQARNGPGDGPEQESLSMSDLRAAAEEKAKGNEQDRGMDGPDRLSAWTGNLRMHGSAVPCGDAGRASELIPQLWRCFVHAAFFTRRRTVTHAMQSQHQWLWWLLRPTWCRLGFLAALVAVGWVYLSFFTPQKRMVRHRLAEADAKSQASISTRLKPLSEVFAKGRKGAKRFAEEALSWRGKWEAVKGLVGTDESHRRYLAELFARHVFSSDELRKALESAIRAYLDDIEGYEAELLVRLRADLADTGRGDESLPAHLRGDEPFREEYRKLAAGVVSELRLDLGVSVGRELGVMLASDLAAQIALQAATDMGVSAGVLGTGAASSVATLGVGMIVAILLDYVLDEIFKRAGYDPAAKIEALVIEAINKLEASLLHDAGTFSFHKKGALRERLEQLHTARSTLRRETIHRLLKEGGLR